MKQSADQLVEALLTEEPVRQKRVRKGMTVEVTSGTGDDAFTWRGVVYGRLPGGVLMTHGSWVGNEGEGDPYREIRADDPTLRIREDIPIEDVSA